MKTVLSNNHWTLADYKQRLTTTEWRNILLAGQDKIIYKGNIVPLKAKNLGAGVVEISKEQETR